VAAIRNADLLGTSRAGSDQFFVDWTENGMRVVKENATTLHFAEEEASAKYLRT
jgi:hypothetical protein